MFNFNAFGQIDPATRMRMELMADAISAYYMAHARGGAVSVEEVDQLSQRAANLGDFIIASEGDHGTPGQRECAAIWGSTYAKDQGRTMVSVRIVMREFNDVYSKIVAGDGKVCPDLQTPLLCSGVGMPHASFLTTLVHVLVVGLVWMMA
eukprot:CAMPEP_0198132268 /NCGR_PEP_ID=MMETSP1442-20131203/57951_1 /TAXON_ID= /ORGANISM="Craspedostauros australis, Strain CCMP3328" /LENGTH=149 /DNA_ID=CAMNT_0043793233 /DNA_START=15 /DNA_END=464 /DNA_ORIENTATION=+